MTALTDAIHEAIQAQYDAPGNHAVPEGGLDVERGGEQGPHGCLAKKDQQEDGVDHG